jgi:hypothetical protein
MSTHTRKWKSGVGFGRKGNYSAADPRAWPDAQPVQSTATPTGEWFCSKCFKKWPMRGMHPDCDGEASDMDAVVTSDRGCDRESAANQNQPPSHDSSHA